MHSDDFRVPLNLHMRKRKSTLASVRRQKGLNALVASELVSGVYSLLMPLMKYTQLKSLGDFLFLCEPRINYCSG